jgi:hypothetical protein
MPAINTAEYGLSLAVVFVDASALRTGPTRVDRSHSYQHAAVPSELVFQLAPEFSPALIENGSIQAGLCAHIAAGILDAAGSRAGHVSNLQVFDADYRVVFADSSRGLVQIITASVGDIEVDSLNARLGFLPVSAELLLSAH